MDASDRKRTFNQNDQRLKLSTHSEGYPRHVGVGQLNLEARAPQNCLNSQKGSVCIGDSIKWRGSVVDYDGA